MRATEGMLANSYNSMNGPASANQHPYIPRKALRWAFLLLLAVLFTCLGGFWLRSHRQRGAVLEIEAMGGGVQFWAGTSARSLECLDFLRPAPEVSVSLWDVDGSLAELDFERLRKSIQALGKVRTLYLAGNRIDDSWLLRLEGLDNVGELVIENTSIGSEGLEHLSEWRRLERLWLGANPRLDDSAIANIKRIPSLNHLHVQDNAITDEAVRELKRVKPNLTTNRGI